MSKIIDMDDWLDKHDLLFGVGILGDEWLMDIAKEAIKARNMRMTREDIELFQLYNNLVNEKTNNVGIIDVNTFIALVDIFNCNEDLIDEINYRLDVSLNKYYSKYLSPDKKIKRFFKSKIFFLKYIFDKILYKH